MSKLTIVACDLCGAELELEDNWSESKDWGFLRIELVSPAQTDQLDENHCTLDVCDKCYKKLTKVGIDKLSKQLIQSLKLV